MKRFILLLIVATFAISACKKDKKTNKPIDEAIIATTWNVTGVKYEYFNESNTKISEEPGTIGDRYVFKDSDKTVKITSNGTNSIKNFALQNTAGKNYLTISNALESNKYEITAYTDKTMTWKKEEVNQVYNTDKLAAKKITTIELHCPCKD